MNLRNHRGVTLLLVFILMIALLGLVSSFLFMAMVQARHSGGHLDDEKAFYVAQAALRRGVWRLLYTEPPPLTNWRLNDGTWPKTEPSGSMDTGDGMTGTYSLTVTLTALDGGPWNVTFDATGTMHGISRRVQRIYRSTNLNVNALTPVFNSWKEI
ncbi:MAG: hypothetical protein HY590_01030 [Candidatus Omnitrophica bacterium]|nr:hypothetical protein [Candidatus Omnitrophota bacterium]